MAWHPTDNNPDRRWTLVVDSCAQQHVVKVKKTYWILADSDTEDVWTGASTPSHSGDDAEGDGRNSTVMATAATLNGAMPEQLEGQRQNLNHHNHAAAGWQSPGSTAEIWRVLVLVPATVTK
ncbi:hypothetical protein JB92DRAFT_2830219 [Gautieria morchelliformis]|nr:hypothetical protein JB92DRAFT_2830219 [Gautieria morchelliformis]